MAKVNVNLSLTSNLEEIERGLTIPEQICGKCLDQPFTSSNSGARKGLFSTQKDHIVGVLNAERPHLQTGYEIRFGDESSSIIEAESNQVVAGIASKFNNNPLESYVVIYTDDNNKCGMYTRNSYEHTTESHGYMYDNLYMDSLYPGCNISKGDVVRKSISYDEHMNRKDGTNVFCVYVSSSRNTEDSILVYDKAAKEKFSTPVINKISITCNDNDIPLNINGDDYNNYKVIPDIGEEVKDGILFAQRRQNKEYSYFTESVENMKRLLISDDVYTVEGTIVDIDIKCNNPNLLATSPHYAQINKYYQDSLRYYSEIISIVNNVKYDNPNIELTYELSELLSYAKRVVAGVKFDRDNNVFNGTIIDITVMKAKPLEVGDKSSDRYGGKGVVSFILPKEQMPQDQWGNVADVVINKPTCVGRENPGQLFEMSCNYICMILVRYLKEGLCELDEAIEMLLSFLDEVSPLQAEALRSMFSELDDEQIATFMDSVLMDGILDLSLRPIQDNMTLDKLSRVYKKFPWIKMNNILMPIQDSMGNFRYAPSYRPIVFGMKYMYRLKQYSEEKFSATSLSATNVKNLNTKSKANKYHKAVHSNTPIALGSMEVDELNHVGIEYVTSMLLVNSVSPQARRLCEQMVTGDPFKIDIKLDEDSANRNVEIMNSYLKVKGEKFIFRKIPKIQKPLFTMSLFNISKPGYSADSASLFSIIKEPFFDYDEYYKRREKFNEMKHSNLFTLPLFTIKE